MKNFSILILCAGFGQRMLDLTIDIPKPLLKVNNQTLLGNTINFFQDLGFHELFINTHYKHEKIMNYINNNFKKKSINMIFEPTILGTGGAVKNIFNYTNNKTMCVVNSDIFWNKDNKLDVINFLSDQNNIVDCKLMLSRNKNFHGLKKTTGDFSISNGSISSWQTGEDIFFYSGLQLISKKTFKNMETIFQINNVWNNLINQNKLRGSIAKSNILHIGDKNAFEGL